jgi:hypothetical protein
VGGSWGLEVEEFLTSPCEFLTRSADNDTRQGRQRNRRVEIVLEGGTEGGVGAS